MYVNVDDVLAEFLVELLAKVCVVSIRRGRGVQWYTCVMVCIHSQRKGSAMVYVCYVLYPFQRKGSVMVYMCYVLYPFVEEGECDGIHVLCVVYIHRGREMRWFTCVMCCIHSQKKGSEIVYMYVCVVSIHGGRGV